MNFRGGQTQDEGAILGMVSISQRFDSVNLVPLMSNDQDNPFFMADLVLWNVLGFALDDESYDSVVLVCKDWKLMAHKIDPPVIRQIARLNMRSMTTRNDTVISETQFSALFQKAIKQICDRASSLCIQGAATEAWPKLQPRFQIILMCFVYTGEYLETSKQHELQQNLSGYLRPVRPVGGRCK